MLSSVKQTLHVDEDEPYKASLTSIHGKGGELYHPSHQVEHGEILRLEISRMFHKESMLLITVGRVLCV